MELDDITGTIVDAAMKIHTDLGPGLLESVDEAACRPSAEFRRCHAQVGTASRGE